LGTRVLEAACDENYDVGGMLAVQGSSMPDNGLLVHYCGEAIA
jgi:hypothetical protein